MLRGILYTVQKNVNIHLKLLFLQRPVCRIGPLLVSGNLALGVFPVNSEL